MEVEPGSPAAVAGLRKGDTIVGFKGQPISTIDHLHKMLVASEIGVPSPLMFLRETEKLFRMVVPRELPPIRRANRRSSMNEPININEASFERAVFQSPIPVLVDFWAAWCGPCKMIAPVLNEIAKENEGRFRVAKVNIDDDPALQQRFNIRGVPALLFFSGGQLRDQIIGVAAKQTIMEKLEKLAHAGATKES